MKNPNLFTYRSIVYLVVSSIQSPSDALARALLCISLCDQALLADRDSGLKLCLSRILPFPLGPRGIGRGQNCRSADQDD
jgi:hypothetical protein